MAAPPPSIAKDLFEDMGRKVADAQGEGIDDGESKVVDEIETLCMNCHENVRKSQYFSIF